MKFKILNLNEENYDKETFEKISIALEILDDLLVRGVDFKGCRDFIYRNRRQLEEEPDYAEIYKITQDALGFIMIEKARSAS